MTIYVSRNWASPQLGALMLICVVGAIRGTDGSVGDGIVRVRNGYFGVYTPVGGDVMVSTLLTLMSGVFASNSRRSNGGKIHSVVHF